MRHMKNQKVSQETKKKMIEMRMDGKPYRYIMQECKLKSLSHVKYILDKYKLVKKVSYIQL